MWQSEEMEKALAEDDPITRLINVFELLHPYQLSDSKHGLVDCPSLTVAAREADTITGAA